MSRVDAFWMGLSCLIAGYVCGSMRETYLNGRDLKVAIEQARQCRAELEHADWQKVLAEVE